ncbi:MAG: glycoside hydrolase family 3 N-terminal domain-containing protein [Caldilineaceae bacterium]
MIRAKNFRDASASIDDRVSNLLEEMTLDEKIAQLGSCWVFQLLTHMKFDPLKAAPLMGSGIGQVTRLAGASSLGPNDAARLANQIQKYLVESTTLGIPALIHEECCSGYMARNATCFPQTIGVACTWEPELAQAMAAVVRQQMRAAGAHQGLSPLLDVTRDPRWGRTEETYGEDPYLVASMGVEFVRGLHGRDLTKGVMATGKHFVGYGASEGGLNWAPPHINARELHEVYLFPFEAAVKEAGLLSIMNAYNELDGIPCGSSYYLLTDLLRRQWGFEGVTVSDYFAINQLFAFHQIAADKQGAAVKALTAGLDVELPSTDCYGAPLRAALDSGAIDISVIDSSVARHLRMKFTLGLFENPYVDEGRAIEMFDTAEQRQLAREIARKSIVLLKNDGDLLPLANTIKSIAVIGPNADSVRNLIGDYAYPCHVESLNEMIAAGGNVFDVPTPESIALADTFVPIKSILQVLRERLQPEVKIHYAQGSGVLERSEADFGAAIMAARAADVAIVVVGDRAGLTDPCTTGEARDRAELRLPGAQEELVEAVQGTGTPVVVVLVNGRPAAIPWIDEHVPAIVETWLPSEEGADAIVDVLLGDYNPGGKLAITVPRGVGQVPIYYGHKASGGRSQWKTAYVEMSNKPLYPFGHGLSYTTFLVDNLRVTHSSVRPGEQITLTVDVTNTGTRAGDEVVQVYIRLPDASVTRPVKELKGFRRVHLAAGERRSVRFVLPVNQCAYLDDAMQLVVAPGRLELMVGTSSEDLPLRTQLQITGGPTGVDRRGAFFSLSEVI